MGSGKENISAWKTGPSVASFLPQARRGSKRPIEIRDSRPQIWFDEVISYQSPFLPMGSRADRLLRHPWPAVLLSELEYWEEERSNEVEWNAAAGSILSTITEHENNC